MTARPVLRLFFDHGAGGCLWPGDDAARDRFGLGPIDAGMHDGTGGIITPPRLQLSPGTLALRDALLADHLTALDPEDPAGPGLWSDEDWRRFNARVAQFHAILQGELGSAFLILNEQDPS